MHTEARGDSCTTSSRPWACSSTQSTSTTRPRSQPTTRLVWVESPTNPLLAIVDIAAVAKYAHDREARCVVDNTFATPYLQRPLELGADAVVHSTTKYLGGHSDVVGGFVAVLDDELAASIGFLQNVVGAVPAPLDCWLVLRGVKTLAVRMKQHDQNGRVIAEFLHQHKKVKKVFYPGLLDHPQHELAKRQMTGFGSMITFETGSLSNARKMLKKVRVCSLGESLGGVETLISHPATMTHAALGEKGRKQIGITDGMVRISVGIEDAEDIITDLDEALSAI